jgi:hypothetical protein
VDTTAKQAMFTVVVPSIPSIVVRVGADNQSNRSEQRLRSIYFKKFTYPNSFLAKPALVAFNGNENNNKVKLQWELSADNALSTVVVERGTSPSSYSSIGELWVNNEGVAQNNFYFNDNIAINGNVYYRLKMIAANGAVTYSNTLTFLSAAVARESFSVYPTVIQSSATVSVKAAKAGNASFQVVDYSGRVVMQKAITVQEGSNNILVNNLDNIITGNYVVVVKTADQQTYNQKIIKQ